MFFICWPWQLCVSKINKLNKQQHLFQSLGAYCWSYLHQMGGEALVEEFCFPEQRLANSLGINTLTRVTCGKYLTCQMMTLPSIKVRSPLASILCYSYEYYISRAPVVSVCILCSWEAKPVIFFLVNYSWLQVTFLSLFFRNSMNVCVCVYMYMNIHIILCVHICMGGIRQYTYDFTCCSQGTSLFCFDKLSNKCTG